MANNYCLGSFHVYPSKVQSFAAYDRSTPLACDTIEFDTTGCFNVSPTNPDGSTGYCFVAAGPCIVQFQAQVLWANPVNTADITLLITKNVLPPPGGQKGGEIAGTDYAVSPGSQVYSGQVFRTLQLVAGDKVWCIPCINSGGTLTTAVGGMNGTNNCNYFEGTIVG